MYYVRLTLFEARQAGPVSTALHTKPTGNARPEALRPRELPDEVHLVVVVCNAKVKACVL